MRNAGFILILLGASSFVFPLMGRVSLVMSLFGRFEKPAAGLAVGLGAVLFALSFRKKKPAQA